MTWVFGEMGFGEMGHNRFLHIRYNVQSENRNTDHAMSQKLSINDVTRFGGKTDSPSPLCHILSQISEPPFQNNVTCSRPPPRQRAK